MILKFSKQLNKNREYSLLQIDVNDEIISTTDFNNKQICETSTNYYYYSDKIVDIENLEKFKIQAKKGDIVSLTGRDNSYLVFPSKKTFAIAFNLNYDKVLHYEYKEVFFDGIPYQVKYVTDKEDKENDGVVYTLKQLCTYISTLISGYNYHVILHRIKEKDDNIKRVLNKYYDKQSLKFDKKYELNVKKVGKDDTGKWRIIEYENVSKSNKYMYDYYLIYAFAHMILAKSKKDKENKNDPKYCFTSDFETIDDVISFFNENQDIVNRFFIETNTLFERPNDMYTSYAPHINGVYMFYECNDIKVYIYRSIDKQYFKDKSLVQTYVSTKYRHKILNIKNIFGIKNDY